MKGNSFKYLLKQGVKNLWSNRMMTLASVGVLTACLLIVGFAVLLTENINNMVKYMEDQNEVVAFMYTENDYHEKLVSEGQTAFTLSSETPEGETAWWDQFIEETKHKIETVDDNILEVTFVSKEEGLEQQKEQWGEKGSLLDDYQGDENPLPDSFVVKIKDLSKLAQTKSSLEQIEGIESVRAADSVADTLTDIKRIVNIVGWSIVAALVVVSLVIITNTIRATIFSRRKELNIMKYVGATNSFIRIPFIVEGICLGLISAVVAYLCIWLGYSYALGGFLDQSSSWLQSAFASIIPFKNVALDLGAFFLISSVAIGVLGSVVSIRNHIKV